MDVKQRSSNFRKFRKKQGLTLVDVAKKMGVSHTAVSRWDNGTGYPKIKRLPKLARILGCKPADLI